LELHVINPAFRRAARPVSEHYSVLFHQLPENSGHNPGAQLQFCIGRQAIPARCPCAKLMRTAANSFTDILQKNKK
jgi:hypothetical protein